MSNAEPKANGTGETTDHEGPECDRPVGSHGPAATVGSGGDPAGVTAGLFDRVLVVTDETAAGRAAVDAGLGVARAHGADVDALYVVDATHEWDILVEREEDTGEAAVEEAAARGAELGVDVEKWFRYGTDHDEVLDFARGHDADLIVVGSAKPTGVERVFNPDTLPTRVQRHAAVPVLVVGPDEV